MNWCRLRLLLSPISDASSSVVTPTSATDSALGDRGCGGAVAVTSDFYDAERA